MDESKTRRHVAWTAIVVALALSASCGAPEPAPGDGDEVRPHVLLVTFDTVRADHSSAYGHARRTTPVLDSLAAEGARFEAVYAPMGVTGPAHATLFTSLHPQVHGVRRNGVALGESPPVLAGLLRERGWRTAAFVGSFVVSGRFGFGRGFDHFDDAFTPGGETFRRDRWEGHDIEGAFDRRAAETTDRALAWLETEAGDGPVFLWVHYFDPHRPYSPPDEVRGRFPEPEEATPLALDVLDYDHEISYADAELGRLVAAMEAHAGDGSLLVVATADHGEGLMDHGWPTHGPLLYEEEVRVPLVLRWPGRIEAGLVVRPPVGLIDVTPTLLDLLAVPRHDLVLQGVTAAPALRGEEELDSDRPVYMMRRHYETERMSLKIARRSKERATIELKGTKSAIRRGRWKYIETPAEAGQELYDLELDPGERENIAAREPDRVRELAALLAAWGERQESLAPAEEGRLSPEDEERLRGLGYVP